MIILSIAILITSTLFPNVEAKPITGEFDNGSIKIICSLNNDKLRCSIKNPHIFRATLYEGKFGDPAILCDQKISKKTPLKNVELFTYGSGCEPNVQKEYMLTYRGCDQTPCVILQYSVFIDESQIFIGYPDF